MYYQTVKAMKSIEIFNGLIGPVNCKFGAPMGRTDNPPKFFGDLDQNWDGIPYFDRIVPLDSGGYDKGGAYWGYLRNEPLRVRYSKDGQFWQFYR